MIGNEHVQFEEGVSIADAAAIVVKKPDGRKIIYWDDKADFSVDEVLIEMPDGTKSTYSRGSGSELDTVVISEAQGQYRDYLDKIYEINKKKGLESIK
ncbi:MAG: hypothetical protein Q8N77_04450 [Nanoarchaeota archaeon]|nr:hypothetical protein [Nanoarchaeota archaeon]